MLEESPVQMRTNAKMGTITTTQYPRLLKYIQQAYIQSFDESRKLQADAKELYDEAQELVVDIANVNLWIDLNTFGTGIEPLFERMKCLVRR
jgi:hypothetical protein